MRIRTIKPAFWTNEKMSRMPDFTKLLAIGLLNYADDHGYFWSNPLMIRGALFPFDEDSSKIRRALAQLAAEGFIRLGRTADGREAGHVIKFSLHQRVDRATDSDIQPLVTFDEPSTMPRRALDEPSSLDRKGLEGIGYIPPAPQPVEKKRARDELFDSFALACGTDPFQLTQSAARTVGVKLAEIRKASPAVRASDFMPRALRYRDIFPTASLTPSALCAHWAECDPTKPFNGKPHAHQKPNSRSYSQTDDYSQLPLGKTSLEA